MSLRLGINVARLDPIKHVNGAHPPFLFMAGTENQYTSLEKSQSLYAAASEPKESFWIEGAAHEDLYRFAGANYAKRVEGFLGKYLRGQNQE